MNYICKPFENDQAAPHNVMVQIFRAHRWMSKSCRNMMSGIGYDMLNEKDYAIITVLDSGRDTVEDIVQHIGWPIKIIKGQVLHLETLGYLKIIRDHLNETRKQIVFTDKGLQLINDLSNVVTQAELLLGQRIGITDLNTIRSVFSSDWGPSLKESDLFLHDTDFNKTDSKLDI